MRKRLHRGEFADAGGDDVSVLWLQRGRADHEIAVENGPANHAVACCLEGKDVIGRKEPTVGGDESLAMFRQERRLTRMDSAVERNWLSGARSRISDEPHATRPGRIPLDITLLFQGMEKVGDRLGRLDTKLSRYLPNTRLKSVFSEK